MEVCPRYVRPWWRRPSLWLRYGATFAAGLAVGILATLAIGGA